MRYSAQHKDVYHTKGTQEESLEAIEANAFLRLGPTQASFDEVDFWLLTERFESSLGSQIPGHHRSLAKLRGDR